MSLQGCICLLFVLFLHESSLRVMCEPHLSVQVGGAVPVLPEELQATLYRPTSQEWPQGGRDATCTRILRGLDQVMSLAIAEPFIAPVDLNRYPSYALIVEYPIDLSTIKVSAHGTDLVVL
jgi:bromodomain and WD repeat domain-containing protein 1/3